MPRTILIILAVLMLAGCDGKDEARARNEKKLPVGCRIIDLDYGDLRAAIICDGRATTTTLRSWSRPKQSPGRAIVAEIGVPNG